MIKLFLMALTAFLLPFSAFFALQFFSTEFFFYNTAIHSTIVLIISAISFLIFYAVYNSYKQSKNVRLFVVALAFYIYGFSFLPHAISTTIFSDVVSEIATQYGLFFGTLIFVVGLV